MKVYFRLRAPIVFVLALASLCFGVQAQERCNVEVKLLLSPTQVKSAISLLRAEKELHDRIYFYDTAALDLLSKGVILRLRQGVANDLTVKLRPQRDTQFSTSSTGDEQYKCEVEMVGGVENRSYSMQTKYVAEHVPGTGEELLPLLSSGQKRLLEDSRIRIDWTQVKQVADIQSTSWTSRAQAPLGKLSLELWEWPNGRIFEVSTKVGADAGSAAAYTKLESLVKKKGLTLSANQRSKTATALEAMNVVRAH